MKREHLWIRSIAVAGCIGAAGLAIGQTGAQPTRTDQPPRQPDRDRNLVFMSGDKIDGLSVKGPDGKKVGTVDDLIIDRGSGAVRYVVIDTGIASKSVAAPYADLSWSGAGDETFISMTKDQLKMLPEFSAKRWGAGPDDMATDGEDTFTERVRREYRQETRDPFAENLRDAQVEEIEGTVERVGRDSTWASDEQVVLTIKTADGSRKVAVGPSWYVMSQDRVPVRGEKITVHAFKVPEKHEIGYVASKLTINGKDVEYRGADRNPHWVERTEGGQSRYYPRQQFLLLSNIDGKNVKALGQPCGDVRDVIVERNSGRAVFLVIDPDQNFLGMADTKRLIPFSLLSFSTRDEIGVDATKQMILNSTTPPEDYAMLSRETVENVHRTFDVDAPRYNPATRPK